MLRTFFPLSMAVALTALPAIAQASGPLHAFSSLNYARQQSSGSIVFLPYLASDPSYEQGITFYTSYYNDVQQPVVVGASVKSVDVYVTPTAHRNGGAEYNAFFDNTTRVDAQEFWFTSTNPCSLSSELDPYIAGFPAELQPVVRAAGYPQACFVQINYRASQEASLLALLKSNRGIVLQDQLPFCTAASPVFSTAPIVADLESARALADDGAGNLTGSWNKVVYELRKIKQHQPALLGGSSASYGASVFLRDALDFLAPDTATLFSGYDDAKMTACIPAPFPLKYGQ